MNIYRKLDHLCEHHADLLGVRAVRFLRDFYGRPNAAGRAVRLAEAAVGERTDYHTSYDADDWKPDSETLYRELLRLAEQIGSLSKERCAYWLDTLHAEPTAAGRLRLISNMHTKNERHVPALVREKVENLHALNGKDAYGQRPEPTEYDRLTA